MRNATLRQLKTFETVARHLSFSRAAEELHLTQPAVSTQIRTLEGHVGATLFEQLGKKTFLTQAGAELLPFSRAIIQQFEDAEAAMAQHRGISGGRLDVAVISAGDYFFPQLMVAFARRHPGVQLNLTVHNREELLGQLAANRTDLAVMVRPPSHDTQNDAFAPHPYVIVAAPQHPLAEVGREPIALRELVRHPFVVRERGSDTWHSMEDAFGPRLAELQVAMEIKSTETIKQAVIAGIGLGFLSAHTIGREVAAGSLVVLPVERFPLMLNWYVVHRREKRLPPVASAFRQFLLDDGAEWIGRLIPTAG
ncbi:LysR family transcriptional regulator [Pseudoduganella sp. SL102]|uniref:LysR family transcriptional regulator n=1 Tax=Pseudoduganella albidiflava TaxID=321983 RepID=A0A411X4E2_9BURK|nr:MULTISPECIES: LysR family transcriptional regulator [Pseudoduganella]QBI03887.1 LysR family transcriptional regulator [Pseudoduganella albidiflava]WBS03561.1 LysR family transcriptional regulator [Pseudoduganella sp. SL102]GGY23022.1 LysR family transcriptional regulator [Pseudoduganella albidiflava]